MLLRKMAAGERPREIHVYTVRGAGYFPVDMLRYDACWPSNGTSVASMGAPSHPEYRDKGERTVEMMSYQEPTVGRWLSFGWEVVNPNSRVQLTDILFNKLGSREW